MSSLSTLASVTSTLPSASETPRSIQVRGYSPGVPPFSDFSPFHSLMALHAGWPDLFSLQSLVKKAAHVPDVLFLYMDGCQVEGKPDCSLACHNRTLLFGSLETLYNCIALTSLAYWSRQRNGLFISDDAERNASAIMGSSSLASFDDQSVLDSFIMCAQEACSGDGLHKPCDESVTELRPGANGSVVFEAMDQFCPDMEAEINPDIFGPGVLISYIMQVSFSITLFLLLKSFTFWVRHSQMTRQEEQGHHHQWRRPPSFRLKRHLTRIESMLWRDSSALSRTSIAIATTLVEFQEAQCWFVFAIQIASVLAIVVNSQEGAYWGEIILNAGLAFHVSQNGILPMFLVQICLHHEGIRNWHTFLGFLVEYLLAIVATTQKVYFLDAFRLFKKQHQIQACGGNPSPRSYCAATQGVEGMHITFFPDLLLYQAVFLILHSAAIGILILDQLSWTLRRHRLTRRWKIKIRGCTIGWTSAGRPGLARLRFKSWTWRVLEALYFIVNVLYLLSLLRIVGPDSFEASKWSYGQIVAVTVWGPVIVKMLDLALSGPPRNGQRLSSGPPRLRIDNVINRRDGTSASVDEELEAEEAAGGPSRDREASRPPIVDLRRRSDRMRNEETDLGDVAHGKVNDLVGRTAQEKCIGLS